ncbi:MAG: amino acid deaminase, partial [Limnohabitans sp.]
MYASASFQTKGLPVAEGQNLLDPLPSRGWRVLDDRLPYPLATLSRSALSNNLRWQQDWARRKGVELAPHGKTTLSPELFDL